MKYMETAIPGVRLLEPKVYNDARGYFMETYRQADFERLVAPVHFVQDNESGSIQGVLRGLHYQLSPYAQAKLVRVILGRVLDVAVDIRRGSPTFGQTVAVELSGENRRQLFIPRGFAHGFHVLSRTAVFTYSVDNLYMPSHERGIRFDDPSLGIDWQIADQRTPLVSDKDMKLPFLQEAEINFDYT
ncbi:MAG: dTDP-4-dehydrorhamnose 3,5-epimerase [Tannerella sp.]|jgi:dTDP-4-dehydrorhamnose 3,5-epimerase|nr:dTDP-4-dehydrorhamnose 3,5-epimerase [Tannerella sp.]